MLSLLRIHTASEMKLKTPEIDGKNASSFLGFFRVFFLPQPKWNGSLLLSSEEFGDESPQASGNPLADYIFFDMLPLR